MKLFASIVSLFIIGAATAQNPTILQGNYITNVFGNSNFVLNPNAQTNTANVAVSNATVTRSTTTPLVATSEFNITTSTATGYADWSLRTFDAGMKNNNCEARFTYRGFSVGSTTAQILQGANVVAQLTLTPSTDPRIASINFPCGDLSAVTKFRLQQASASLTGTNEIGGIYVGLATNMANVAQAENVVQASRSTSQTIASSGIPSVFIYTSKALDVYDEYNATTGVFKAKRAGNYLIQAAMLWQNLAWTAGNEYGIQVFKNSGITCETYDEIEASQTMYKPLSVSCSITLAVGDEVTIRLSQLSGVNKDTYAGIQNQLSIFRFPSSSELVVTPERQNVFGGVAWSGSVDISTISATTNTIINTTNFGTPIPFGKASVASSSCGLTANDVGVCFENVPPGTYEVTTSFEQGSVYSFGTPGATACSARIHVSGTSFADTSVASAFTEVGAAGQTDWVTLSSGVVTISSFQPKLALVLKQSKSGGNGRCIIRSSANGTTYPAKPTITFKPLDQPSNSALYVQGPVKAAETGAAIPAGYVFEAPNQTSSALTLQSSGAWKTGTGITLQPGIYLIRMWVNVGAVAPTNFQCGISQSINASPLTDSSNFTQMFSVTDFANTTQAKDCMLFGYHAVTAAKTFYPAAQVITPSSSSYTFDFRIQAIRLN